VALSPGANGNVLVARPSAATVVTTNEPPC